MTCCEYTKHFAPNDTHCLWWCFLSQSYLRVLIHRIFFYGDDIDFDNGEFDTNIQNFDSFDNQAIIYSKKEAISNAITQAKALLGSDAAVYADGDACDVLLEEFHRNVEEENYVEWVGSTVIDVCRAQGTTDYVKFESMDEIFTQRIWSYVFEDLVLCAKDIYESRPSGYENEQFVFIGELDTTSEQYLRIPFSVNEDALDEHGRIKADASIEDIYKFTSDTGACGTSKRLHPARPAVLPMSSRPV